MQLLEDQYKNDSVKYMEGVRRLAIKLDESGVFDKALKYWSTYAENMPNSVYGYYAYRFMAICCIKLGRQNDAILCLTKFFELIKQDSESEEHLAYMSKDMDLAIWDYIRDNWRFKSLMKKYFPDKYKE